MKNSTTALLCGLFLCSFLPTAHAQRVEPIIRNMKPSVVSLTLGYPQVPLGISYNYNLDKHWAIGANMGSFLMISNLEVNTRYYFSEGFSSLFLQANGGGTLTLFPTVGAAVSPYLGVAIGYENRTINGFTFTSAVGSVVSLPAANDFSQSINWIPQGSISFGYAY